MEQSKPSSIDYSSVVSDAILILHSYYESWIADAQRSGKCMICYAASGTAHDPTCIVNALSAILTLYPSTPHILPARLMLALERHREKQAGVLLANGQAVHQCLPQTCAGPISVEYANTFHLEVKDEQQEPIVGGPGTGDEESGESSAGSPGGVIPGSPE